MKYSFTCPAPNCGHTMKVEAENEDQAVEMLLMEGDKHGKEVHPNLPQQTPEEAQTMVRVGMKKVETM